MHHMYTKIRKPLGLVYKELKITTNSSCRIFGWKQWGRQRKLLLFPSFLSFFPLKLKSICMFISELVFAICLPAHCCGQKSRLMAYVTRKLIQWLLYLVPSYMAVDMSVTALMNTTFKAAEINAGTLVYRCITFTAPPAPSHPRPPAPAPSF